MSDTRVWGKAGQRLTDAELERRRTARAARRFKTAQDEKRAEVSRARDDEVAHSLWEHGLLVPWRITAVLDAQGLDGPEVDEACGAAEPDVDLWEAGQLYPTWEQTVRLAALCLVTPRFLMQDYRDSHRLEALDTTLRFHLPAHAFTDERPHIDRFTDRAVRNRLGDVL